MKETTDDAEMPATVDLRPGAEETERISAALDVLAADLRALWCRALEGGDFEEITRLAEAGHAVQCAVIALRADNVLVARTEP